MAESARRHGYSSNLVRFFEGMPGRFETEADVMPYAEDPSKPPFGEAIALELHVDTDTEDPRDCLTLPDITQGTHG